MYEFSRPLSRLTTFAFSCTFEIEHAAEFAGVGFTLSLASTTSSSSVSIGPNLDACPAAENDDRVFLVPSSQVHSGRLGQPIRIGASY